MKQIDQDPDIRPSEMNHSTDWTLSGSEICDFLITEINYLLICKLEEINKYQQRFQVNYKLFCEKKIYIKEITFFNDVQFKY